MSEPKEQDFLNHPPHDQSRYPQRHTVQETTFLISLRLQGGVVSKIPFREMCVCDGGFFDVGRLPERHRQGQGGSYAAALRLTLYKIYAYFIRFSKTNYQFFFFSSG